jgi:hypothetical protein
MNLFVTSFGLKFPSNIPFRYSSSLVGNDTLSLQTGAFRSAFTDSKCFEEKVPFVGHFIDHLRNFGWRWLVTLFKVPLLGRNKVITFSCGFAFRHAGWWKKSAVPFYKIRSREECGILQNRRFRRIRVIKIFDFVK